MTTVNLGTCAVATAVTILAPSLAMPAFSYFRPTMKPVMFCRKNSGMPRWAHSSTKWAPFSADSAKRMPLLATMPHGDAVELGEAGHQGGAVTRLELVEAGAVDDAGDHLAHVEGLAGVAGDDAVELGRIVERLLGSADAAAGRPHPVEVGHHPPRQLEGVGVVLGQVIGHAGEAGVDVAAAQVLGAHHLAGGRLHQRRAAQEDGPLVAHDDGLVAHGRHVGAAGGAGAHHHRDLRDAAGREVGLVVEDAAEVVAVREDLVLPRQEGAARVDQVDAGEPVLLGDLLGPQVLLHRERVVGAALDGGVVGDDHALQRPAPARSPAIIPAAGASPS